jgi:hypothetical protein
MSEKTNSKKRISKGDKEGEKGTFSQVPDETPSIAKNVIDYIPVSRRNLNELKGKIVYVTNVWLEETPKGKQVIVLEISEKLGEPLGEYVTMSKQVINEYKKMKELIEKGFVLRVKIGEDPRGWVRLERPR